MKNISKVSTGFELFLLGFAAEFVLILNVAVLEAEFCSFVNDVNSRGNHRGEIFSLQVLLSVGVGLQGRVRRTFDPISTIRVCSPFVSNIPHSH